MPPARRRTNAQSYLLQHQPDPRAGPRKLSPRPKRCRSGNFPISSTSPSTPASRRPAIDCNTRSCWRGRSCWPRWCCWPRLSACGSSAFGGVQKMVLSGVASGFLLYVLSKVTEDLSKAELMPPMQCRVAAGGDRRHDRVCRVVVPGGRVMAGVDHHSRVFCRRTRVKQSAPGPVERGDDRCRLLV